MNYADQREAIRIRLDQRTDLDQVIIEFSQGRFAYWGKYFFYASDTQDTTINTVAGQVYYNLPGMMRNVRKIRLALGGVWFDLNRLGYNGIFDILETDLTIPPIQSIPSAWAQFGTTFRLYPLADQAYNLELTGNAAPPFPVQDTDDNYWTDRTDAGGLIIADTCAQIFKYYLGAPDRAAPFDMEVKAQRYALMKTSMDLGGPKIFKAYGPGFGSGYGGGGGAPYR